MPDRQRGDGQLFAHIGFAGYLLKPVTQRDLTECLILVLANTAQSWHLRRGLSVWHAAGLIHSDIQRGFVRAEVVSWDALRDAGGYAGARDRGTLRLEGRDYVVADGDVITVKFTP